MPKITRFLNLFLIIVLFLSPFLVLNNIKEVKAETGTLTVTGGKAYIDYTTVYEDFFLIFNGTTILKYDLVNLVLLDSISMGGSVAPTETLLKYDEWYLEYNDGGVVTYAVLDIPNFVIKDTVITTKLVNFTGDLMSLAYIQDSGIDYWSYVFTFWISGAGATEGLSSFVFPFWDTGKIERRFGVLGNIGFSGYPITATVQHYVYNGTGDVLNSHLKNMSATGSFAFESWAYAQRTELDGSADTWQEYRYYGGGGHLYMGVTSKQFKMDIDYDNKAVSVTYGVLGLRDDTFTVTHGLADSLGEIYIWLDNPTTWYKIRDSDINNIDISAFTKGSFGGKTSYTLTENSIIATQRVHIIAIEQYVDSTGSLSSYLAYVDTSKNIQIDKIVGATMVDIYSFSVSPDSVNVYSGYRNMIGVYTLGATNHVYVYNSLIPASEISGYSDTLLAQLYRAYESSDFLVHYVKFMLNNSLYTPCANDGYDYYIDGVYQSSGTLDENGILARSYYSATLPKTLSYFVNKTGYIAKWFNITLYSTEPLYLDVTEPETPILSLNIYPLNLTDNLRIELSINRFTGESYTEYYFVNKPKISIIVETFGLNEYYNSYTVSPYEVSNGFAPSTFVYQVPYNYRVTYYYTSTVQTEFIQNVTETTIIQFTYDSQNDIVSIGGYVTIPTIDLEPEIVTGLPTIALILSLVEYLPIILLVLAPTLVLMGLAVSQKASSGFFVIVGLIGLNLGVGVCVWINLIPFYVMILTILIDALTFVFLLKSGNNGGGLKNGCKWDIYKRFSSFINL